jgi:hypothetical protein
MSINIYDFDGVLSCPIEDAVFRLDPVEYGAIDAEFITNGRKRYGITTLSENMQRNRHLILQEVLYELKVPCGRGPVTPASDPFFVLTARSGPGAVARVSSYLESIKLRPEEMFFTGPVAKTHFLIDLCHKFEDHKLTFYDDTYHHIEAAIDLGLPNLTVEYVDNKVADLKDEADALYIQSNLWLRNQY